MANLELSPALPIRIDLIAPDPDQPRRSSTPEDLAALVLSIRAEGVIQPVLVSPHPVPSAWNLTPYMLVTGERRWTAARRAGLQQIPANLVARKLSAADRLMVQLEENDGALRRELSLADRVEAVMCALRLSGLRHAQFAAAHGKTATWISHYCALAKADEVTRAALAEGRLTGMATALLFLRLGAGDREELLERARRNDLPITGRLIDAAAGGRGGEADADSGAPGAWAEAGAGKKVVGAGAGARARGAGAGAAAEAEAGAGTSRLGAGASARALGAGAAAGAAAEAEAVGEPAAAAVAAEREPDAELAVSGAAAEAEPGAELAVAAAAAAEREPGAELAVSAAGRRPAAGEDRAFTFAFSLRQLENLIVLLGEAPGPTPEVQLRQLASLLEQKFL